MKSQDLEKRIIELAKLKDLVYSVEKNPTTLEENLNLYIFEQYLVLENVSSIAKNLNKKGYKIFNNETKKLNVYKSNDITSIIELKDPIENVFLCYIVKGLFKRNKKAAFRHHN